MSVSLSDWLRPVQLLFDDDHETGGILAECELLQLADVYLFLYRNWQQGKASAMLDSLQVLSAVVARQWMLSEEADAWRGLLARRLLLDWPSWQGFLAALERETGAASDLTQWIQADAPHWAELECPARSLAELTQQLPAPLKVRQTPVGYALAVRASSFVVYGQPINDADFLRDLFWPDVQATLNDYWQVHSAKDCRQLLYWLSGQGQRYAWQLDFQWLQKASEEERTTWRSELPEDFGGYVDLLESLQQQPHLDIAAWDWVRMADLALAGYLAGYLNATEWRSFALVALWLLRSQYRSWQQLAQSYLLGYRLWQTQTSYSLSPELEDTWALLANSPFSPQRQLNWQDLSLDHPDFRDALTHFSAGLEDPLLMACLVCSLRDDACLLTGLEPDSLPVTRRHEARDYFFTGLDIQTDEGLTATLSRFWQPGRVHHYDQLALHARVGRPPQLPENLDLVPDVWEAWQQQLPLLAEQVQHPAGVVMAEKYAFYLVKALETGHYPEAECRQLALVLKDYLSWHYSSAQQLLQAWQGWDQVLSMSGDEKPLLAELGWHLKDPGSLFRFLPWKRPPQRFTEPGRALSETDLATLNLVGPLTGIHWSWPEKLPESHRDELMQLLQDTHLFQEAADLKDYLDHLLHAGDRQEYLIAFAPFTLNASRLDVEIEIQEQGERDEEQEAYYQRLLRVKHNALGINDVDLIAWDMVQLVDLAVAGYQLNWLDDDELLGWLARARRQITQEYHGWADFARALLAGYNFFMNETENRAELLEVFSQRVLGLLMAVPPQAGLWYTLAWPGERQRDWNRAATALGGAVQGRLH